MVYRVRMVQVAVVALVGGRVEQISIQVKEVQES
jgi:hypothetical protein